METLKLTNNRKVRFRNNHYNTFSLSPGPPEEGGTCPGSTEGEGGCQSKCYDKTLGRIYKNYKSVEEFNTDLMVDKNKNQIKKILSNTIDLWRFFAKDDKYFRIHTGGDFFNVKYAEAWKDVIDKNKDIQFWAYTRSLFSVPILVPCKNLSLYISADPVNVVEAIATYKKYKKYSNLGIAWMGNELPDIFPKDRFVMTCPEVTKKLKIDKNLGACSRCRVCVDRHAKNKKLRNIQFPIHR